MISICIWDVLFDQRWEKEKERERKKRETDERERERTRFHIKVFWEIIHHFRLSTWWIPLKIKNETEVWKRFPKNAKSFEPQKIPCFHLHSKLEMSTLICLSHSIHMIYLSFYQHFSSPLHFILFHCGSNSNSQLSKYPPNSQSTDLLKIFNWRNGSNKKYVKIVANNATTNTDNRVFEAINVYKREWVGVTGKYEIWRLWQRRECERFGGNWKKKFILIGNKQEKMGKKEKWKGKYLRFLGKGARCKHVLADIALSIH